MEINRSKMVNQAEKNLISILLDLRENFHAQAIKAEFEAEGASFGEVRRLKELVSTAQLNLTVKIGGCEAVTDMRSAEAAGAETIASPMIETPYALKKFVNTINTVYERKENTEFLINIETVTGYKNINEIVELKEFDEITGIVLGRVDMAGSLGLTREEVNTERIFSIASYLSKIAEKSGKTFTVGGGLTPKSILFLKKLPYLTSFQTRKVVFTSKLLDDLNAEEGILKAIEFELMWLEYRRKELGINYGGEEARVKMLSGYLG